MRSTYVALPDASTPTELLIAAVLVVVMARVPSRHVESGYGDERPELAAWGGCVIEDSHQDGRSKTSRRHRDRGLNLGIS